MTQVVSIVAMKLYGATYLIKYNTSDSGSIEVMKEYRTIQEKKRDQDGPASIPSNVQSNFSNREQVPVR